MNYLRDPYDIEKVSSISGGGGGDSTLYNVLTAFNSLSLMVLLECIPER